MSEPTSILLVEDDLQTLAILSQVLLEAGYRVLQSSDGRHAQKVLAQEDELIAVVVTDIRMRDVSGIDVLVAARARQPPAEVILLTGYGSLDSAIMALRGGAYDYLLKPTHTSDLLDRVASAALRFTMALGRSESDPAPILAGARFLRAGELVVDSYQRVMTLASAELRLTPIEYRLLQLLATQPGRVFNCATIVRYTHGLKVSEAEAQALLRSHVRNLRRKLPAGYLITVRSAGYRLT